MRTPRLFIFVMVIIMTSTASPAIAEHQYDVIRPLLGGVAGGVLGSVLGSTIGNDKGKKIGAVIRADSEQGEGRREGGLRDHQQPADRDQHREGGRPAHSAAPSPSAPIRPAVLTSISTCSS